MKRGAVSTKTIQATDLRVRTRDILEAVRWRDAVYQVTAFGTPVAVIVSIDEYARLTGTAPTTADRNAVGVPRGLDLVPERAHG